MDFKEKSNHGIMINSDTRFPDLYDCRGGGQAMDSDFGCDIFSGERINQLGHAAERKKTDQH
jgi:hypothetical protein